MDNADWTTGHHALRTDSRLDEGQRLSRSGVLTYYVSGVLLWGSCFLFTKLAVVGDSANAINNATATGPVPTYGSLSPLMFVTIRHISGCVALWLILLENDRSQRFGVIPDPEIISVSGAGDFWPLCGGG